MRIVLHVDMDAFYAAVEQRDHPELRGEPVIVGGTDGRGVVATCSYEARPDGVHSAMPMAEALRLCPDAHVVSPRMDHYAEVSSEVMSVLDDYSPEVERLSLDEAFLEMTGSEELFGPPDEMARKIRRDIRERTDLVASVGIATNKFLAKLASDLAKPDGVERIPEGREAETIAPLDVEAIWGVGPKTGDTLRRAGWETVGDLADADLGKLADTVGESTAEHIQSLAGGVDPRPVVPHTEQKSVGSERTHADNLRGREAILGPLRRRCEEVARELRRLDRLARGIRVKVRYDDTFQLATRQTQLSVACDDSETLFGAAEDRLDLLDLDRPIRLVGASAYDLIDVDETRQLDLFDSSSADRYSRLEHTVDQIRDELGADIARGDAIES